MACVFANVGSAGLSVSSLQNHRCQLLENRSTNRCLILSLKALQPLKLDKRTLDMTGQQITIETTVNSPVERVWEAYTTPSDITHWNFASDDWCCPSAETDLRVGGTYKARMEAKDGSFGFDFEAIYE